MGCLADERQIPHCENVSMLGKVLGETIRNGLGEHILERVE
ncbi:hypothetical protein ACNKHM_10825 [Shigella sonnei]